MEGRIWRGLTDMSQIGVSYSILL